MTTRPDYTVLANNSAMDRFVKIGVAFESEDQEKGARYIKVILNWRPWGEWNGEMQLHPIAARREEGTNDR